MHAALGMRRVGDPKPEPDRGLTNEDEAWVRVLAENLHRAGRDVFLVVG